MIPGRIAKDHCAVLAAETLARAERFAARHLRLPAARSAIRSRPGRRRCASWPSPWPTGFWHRPSVPVARTFLPRSRPRRHSGCRWPVPGSAFGWRRPSGPTGRKPSPAWRSPRSSADTCPRSVAQLECSCLPGRIVLVGQRQRQQVAGLKICRRLQMGCLKITLRRPVVFLQACNAAGQNLGIERIRYPPSMRLRLGVWPWQFDWLRAPNWQPPNARPRCRANA